MVQKIKDHWSQIPSTRQKSSSHKSKSVVILRGAPDDRGVLNVGGRIGAAYGPSAIRKLLEQMMLGISSSWDHTQLHPGSDITLGATIEQTHSDFQKLLENDLKLRQIPLVLGGGHDYGYPHIAAAAAVYGVKKVGLINIDAHLDVRPLVQGKITSGSPYFLAIENRVLMPQNFIEFGIQQHCNAPEYLKYLTSRKAKVLMLEQCRQKGGAVSQFQRALKSLTSKGLKIVISIDIDAIQMCQAPGVSAPQVDGFQASELFEMIRLCATNKSVISVGFFELSPPLDINQQTTRLVGTAIHRFISNLRIRKD